MRMAKSRVYRLSGLLIASDQSSEVHSIDFGVCAAAVSHEEVKSLQNPDKVSIFTTELVAFNLSLDIVWHSWHKKFVIFPDSLFYLLAIGNLHPACMVLL